MLINRLQSMARERRPEQVRLRQRAEAAGPRRPLVFVPGMFGTRLADSRGRLLWGSLTSLYWGPSPTRAGDARPAGLFTEVRAVPGLYHVDIHAQLLRFLTRVGGYRPHEDLFVLDYDWRAGAVQGAAALDALIRAIRGAGDEAVDVVGVSTGGQILRVFLAHGAPAVRRAVFVAAPQRGTFDALASLVEGFRPAPAGKHFPGRDAADCQTTFDALPHPAERLFVDESGRALDIDHFDAAVWRRWGLDAGFPRLEDRLARARRLHEDLDRTAGDTASTDVIAIGAKHKPTRRRILVSKGRGHVPPSEPRWRQALREVLYTEGDGELSLDSLAAWPDLDPGRLWFVTAKAHCRLPSDPQVHRLILEALLYPDSLHRKASSETAKVAAIQTPSTPMPGSSAAALRSP